MAGKNKSNSNSNKKKVSLAFQAILEDAKRRESDNLKRSKVIDTDYKVKGVPRDEHGTDFVVIDLE